MTRAKTALDHARVPLLGNVAGNEIPDSELLPYLALAWDTLQLEGFGAYGMEFLEKVVVIPGFPAGTTSLDAYVQDGGALQDLGDVLDIREKYAGAPDYDYLPLTQLADDLPVRPPDEFLEEFVCYGAASGIHFVGATQALDLRVRYNAVLLPAASPQDTLPSRDMAVILGYIIAGLYASATGYKTSFDCLAEGRHLLFMWINKQTKARQGASRRLRRFRPVTGFIGVTPRLGGE